jgi:hypothetical protein
MSIQLHLRYTLKHKVYLQVYQGDMQVLNQAILHSNNVKLIAKG